MPEIAAEIPVGEFYDGIEFETPADDGAGVPPT
jgi:hypothetical protein